MTQKIQALDLIKNLFQPHFISMNVSIKFIIFNYDKMYINNIHQVQEPFMPCLFFISQSTTLYA